MAVKTTSLVLLTSALDWLGLTSDGGAQDARLEMLIDAASELIEEHCGRAFSRATVTDEEVATVNHMTDMLLARPPINSANVDAMTFKFLDDTITDVTNYSIDSAEAGIIRNDSGWQEVAAYRSGIAGDAQPGTEKKAYKVTYDGGFVTEVQAAEVGGTYEGETVTLPGFVKLAALDTISVWWRSRGKNPNIKSQRIDDAAESYGDATVGDLPESVKVKLAPACINFGV